MTLDEAVSQWSKNKPKRASADLNSIIDPRFGDIEDDASSTKRRSLLSLAGSMLVEISLPKLVVAWISLLILPGLLIGLAPILISSWLIAVTNRVASLVTPGAAWPQPALPIAW